MSLDPIKSVLDGVSLLAPPWHRTPRGLGVVAREREYHGIAVHGRAMCVKALNEILDVLPSFLFFVLHIPDSSAIQLLEVDTAYGQCSELADRSGYVCIRTLATASSSSCFSRSRAASGPQRHILAYHRAASWE